ncbi:hypothetical protein [Puia sp.]|jgi:hypothetical protein|uniref:hypothetical protein n=1 Tax=Puia sp. TaxID=2045100 RepID=UPI002F3F3754
MRRLLLLLLFITPFVLQAQDVTGIWQGHFRSAGSVTMRNSIFDDRYRFEVQIAQDGKAFQGVTYSYLSTIFYGKAAATGTVNIKTSKVLLQEGKLLEYRNAGNDVCIMTCFLQYTKSGDEEFLEGTYTSMNVRDSSNCGRGTVFLHKVPTSDFYTEPIVARREKEIAETDSLKAAGKTAIRKPTEKPTRKPGVAAAPPHHPPTASTKPKPPAGTKRNPPATARTTPPVRKPATPPVTKPVTPEKVPPPIARVEVPRQTMRQPMTDSGNMGIGRKFPTIAPRVLQDRQNQTVKTLVVHTNEITLNIYDDGAIDHDTVSVYVDNKQVINHAMLTDRPLVVTLHLDENVDYHEVVMVAENEGEIPPNTSLMIVKAGDKEYEVRITSTEQKNAVVKFQYIK